MRKEVIIAIILGFALGLVITFGVWKTSQVLRSGEERTTPTPVEEKEVKPTPPPFTLEIISPEDESISNEGKITLTGKTQKGAVVTIVFEKGEKIIQTDAAGNFEAEIELVSGINEIIVTSFGPGGEEEEKMIEVTYSTAEI